jgi:ABC-2 type transport system permease protein
MTISEARTAGTTLGITLGEKGRPTTALSNNWVLFKRCLRLNLKSGETLMMAILVPVAVMLLFGYVFGGMMEMGAGNFINFIVPGIILMSILQASTSTAVAINGDIKKGFISRLKTMPISRSSILIAHGAAAILRGVIATAAIIIAALFIGFDPQASLAQWFGAAGILFLFLFLATWVNIWLGLVIKDPEAIGGASFLLVLFVYVSSGFTQTDTLPRAMEIFANNQPMTPIADSIRNLFMGVGASSGELWLAIGWCLGLSALAFIAALRKFNKKTA